MTTSNTEPTGNAQATGTKPKPNKKASVAQRRAHVAAAKPKAARKGQPAEQSAQRRQEGRCPRRQQGSQNPRSAETPRRRDRERPGQSNRMAGPFGVMSIKGKDGERTYSVKA